MADVTIVDLLQIATPLAGDEPFETVQDGESRWASADDLLHRRNETGSNAGAPISLTAGQGGPEGGAGGNISIDAGEGLAANGGTVAINAGDGSADGTAAGGSVNINAGDGDNFAGTISLNSGAGDANGGGINLVAGESASGPGGTIYIAAGAGATDGGDVYIDLMPAGSGRQSLCIIGNLPTANPSVAGALWNDSGVLKVSAG